MLAAVVVGMSILILERMDWIEILGADSEQTARRHFFMFVFVWLSETPLRGRGLSDVSVEWSNDGKSKIITNIFSFIVHPSN